MCVEALRARRPPMRDAARRDGFLALLADKEVGDARIRAEHQQEDQRRAEDRALEEARVMNDRRKEDDAKAARRLNEDRVRQDERNRENELAAASYRAEKSLYRRDFQQRFYRR
ncbi:hypothetical protein RvY_07598 [Ramazzottius varieornatus]|uniref:Uncharacterized protein n=1 Tax=Ramazzottius varieornatus TaxID=947166 RepID=A0A1D1VC75_RAMVA|nr:hypothetical protein RvY_07598 [Ramazzottius varieornatus]